MVIQNRQPISNDPSIILDLPPSLAGKSKMVPVQCLLYYLVFMDFFYAFPKFAKNPEFVIKYTYLTVKAQELTSLPYYCIPAGYRPSNFGKPLGSPVFPITTPL